MSKFSKTLNTRAISDAHVCTGQAPYNPSSSSARRTDLSWAALTEALKAGKGKCTVAEYRAIQSEMNPGNVGDAMPCFRYWAGDGNVALEQPES